MSWDLVVDLVPLGPKAFADQALYKCLYECEHCFDTYLKATNNPKSHLNSQDDYK